MVTLMSVSDTTILSGDGETLALRWIPGQRVRVVGGPLQGVEGVVLETREAGRIVVQIRSGVAVELNHLCLEALPSAK